MRDYVMWFVYLFIIHDINNGGDVIDSMVSLLSSRRVSNPGVVLYIVKTLWVFTHESVDPQCFVLFELGFSLLVCDPRTYCLQDLNADVVQTTTPTSVEVLVKGTGNKWLFEYL